MPSAISDRNKRTESTLKVVAIAALVLGVLSFAAPNQASSAEIRLLSMPGMKVVLDELIRSLSVQAATSLRSDTAYFCNSRIRSTLAIMMRIFPVGQSQHISVRRTGFFPIRTRRSHAWVSVWQSELVHRRGRTSARSRHSGARCSPPSRSATLKAAEPERILRPCSKSLELQRNCDRGRD